MTNTAECDAADRKYHVVALEVPIVFNRDGDHDHNGLIFALGHNKQALDCLREDIQRDGHSPWLRTPHPLVRPLVLRARVGETVEIHFENHINDRHVGMHLVADGYDVLTSDGAHVGTNPSSLAGPPDGPPGSNRRTYVWRCRHEGVFPFHDAGNLSGGEDGTNVHGLFGALVVEPPPGRVVRSGERRASERATSQQRILAWRRTVRRRAPGRMGRGARVG